MQGSWNYRTLVGAGLAHALSPLLRWVHAADPSELRESLRRHASAFNGHPYLCGMAVAALARLEMEGREPAEVDRFRAALSGPLGAVGDRAVWAAWRPFCLLAAIGGHVAGLSAGAAVVVFLSMYNAGHLWVRAWAFRVGWRERVRVARAFPRLLLLRLAPGMAAVNVALLGLASAGLAVELPWPGGAGGAEAAVVGGAVLTAYLAPGVCGRLCSLLLAGAVGVWLL